MIRKDILEKAFDKKIEEFRKISNGYPKKELNDELDKVIAYMFRLVGKAARIDTSYLVESFTFTQYFNYWQCLNILRTAKMIALGVYEEAR